VWIRQNKLLLSKVVLLLLILIVIMSGLSFFGCIGRGTKPLGWSGVAVADNSLFLGSMDGELVALSTSNGMRLWGVALETSASTGTFGCAPESTVVAVYGTPVTEGDLVYVGGYNGKIYVIDSSSGLSREGYLDEDNPQPIVGGPAVAQGKVFIGCSDGKVYALRADSLEKVWDFQTGDKIWSTPVIDGSTVYIGSFDKKLYALDAAGGSKKWEVETEGAIASPPLIYNNTVYIGSFDRHLYAVNAITGKLIWKSSLVADSWFWAQPLAYNDVIYAGCLDGKVYILDAESGDEVGDAIALENPVCSSPVLVGSSIIVALENGQVYTIDTGSSKASLMVDIKGLAGEELTLRAPLLAHGEVIYVHAQTKDHGSLLYALNARTGVKLWSVSLSIE